MPVDRPIVTDHITAMAQHMLAIAQAANGQPATEPLFVPGVTPPGTKVPFELLVERFEMLASHATAEMRDELQRSHGIWSEPV